MRFGLAGFGMHGRSAVAEAFRAHARKAVLVAACDPNPANREAAARSGLAAFPDLAAMLARERLDAVYIASLPDTHAALALESFAAGCHVLCEKPMAPAPDECRRMIAAGEKAGKRLSVVFELRFDETMRKIGEWIREGLLGRVEAVHIQHFWDGHKSIGPKAARRARLLAATGALDHGCHFLDIARAWAGGRWSEIRAMGAWLGEDFEKPPHVSVLARLDSGALVTLNVSLSFTAHIEPKAVSHALSVVGTEGVVERKDKVFRLVSARRTEEIERKASEIASIGRLIDAFAAAASGDGPIDAYLPTGEDGLQAAIITEEANRQAARERPAGTAPNSSLRGTDSPA
ncbi:MAG: Gfo/Idh/MocA family oxidoreductase [Planctomycetota bacterium]